MCMRVSFAPPAVLARDCKRWAASPAPVPSRCGRIPPSWASVLRPDAVEEELVFGHARAVPQCGTGGQIRALGIEPDLGVGVVRSAPFARELDGADRPVRRLDRFHADVAER